MNIQSGLRTVYAPRAHTLTQQRLMILRFIDGYIREHGWAPSDTEIRQQIGIESHSWVCRQLLVLQELGCIEFRGSRQIRVLRMPETVAE